MYTNMHQQNNCQSLTNRSYGFKELAVLYFPNIAPASASIRLKQWIKDDSELLEALQETNYQLSNRILTPKQKGTDNHLFRLTLLSPSAAAPTATARTLFARGTPCGKGGRALPPTSVSPKGGRKGG